MKYWIGLIIICTSCSTPVEKALNSKNEIIQRVVDSIAAYEVQIAYSQIDTTDEGAIIFDDHYYNLNASNYFYPASTIKLPIAVLAAEYVDIHENLSLDVPYITDRDDTLHSVGDDIKKIFAVSDNEAYNRLYELLGRDYINNRLREIGLKKTRIAHRLSTARAADNKRASIKFFPSYTGSPIEISGKTDSAIPPILVNKISKGSGYIKEEQLIEEPMDFSLKNYFPLEEQHLLMKKLFFPENYPEAEQFKWTAQTRSRILVAMKALPREQGYDPETYYDSYVKFFMYGDQKDTIPSSMAIYNKVGYAYGTLTETAYIVDRTNNINFLLSATILVNKNGIYNDDTYEYETVGIPFLAQLGREIYALEKERAK